MCDIQFPKWMWLFKQIRLFNVHLFICYCGSGEDSLDGLMRHRCPLTPSLSPRKRTTSQSKTEPPLLRTNKRTIYTAGRPPWYNVTGTTFKEAFVIGTTYMHAFYLITTNQYCVNCSELLHLLTASENIAQ